MNSSSKQRRTVGFAIVGAALAAGVFAAAPAQAQGDTTNVEVQIGWHDGTAPGQSTEWTISLNGEEQHVTSSAAQQTVVFSNMPAGQTYSAQVKWDAPGTPNCSGQAVAQPADSGPAVAGQDYHLHSVTVFYTSMAGCHAA